MNDEISAALGDESTGALDKLQTPCTVFLTMETEHGHEMAKSWHEAVHDTASDFLDEPIWVESSTNPTDIIWEN